MKQAYLPAFLDGIPNVLPPLRLRKEDARLPANDHSHAVLAARLAAVAAAKRGAR